MLWAVPDAIWSRVDVVQVRGKSLATGALEELVRGWVARLAGISRIVVNDRADVALAAGAGGAHLGDEDLPLEDARRAAPRPFLLGASTHNREELVRAAAAQADYAGLGSFFPTATKSRARPLDVGRAGLDGPLEELEIPVLAIGGIDAGRVAEVLRVPAVTGVAVSGAIQSAEDPAGAIAALRTALDEAWEKRDEGWDA